MERSLKERLVGAAVLVAVAIILVPEMLSGPSKSSNRPSNGNAKADSTPSRAEQDKSIGSAQAVHQTPATIDAAQSAPVSSSASNSSVSSEADLKSVTIDLRKSDPQTQVTEQATEIAPLPVTQASSSRGASSSTPVTADARVQEESRGVAGRETIPHKELPAKESVPKEAATSPATAGWAVQLASFGTRVPADQLADELKKAGFVAFVMPFDSKGKTMYRVRLGPFRDRPSAESVQAKVKQTHAAATVVPHP